MKLRKPTRPCDLKELSETWNLFLHMQSQLQTTFFHGYIVLKPNRNDI